MSMQILWNHSDPRCEYKFIKVLYAAKSPKAKMEVPRLVSCRRKRPAPFPGCALSNSSCERVMFLTNLTSFYRSPLIKIPPLLLMRLQIRFCFLSPVLTLVLRSPPSVLVVYCPFSVSPPSLHDSAPLVPSVTCFPRIIVKYPIALLV